MKYYLIIVYSSNNQETILKVDEEALFRFIDNHREDGEKFAVFKIGDCLLDWS